MTLLAAALAAAVFTRTIERVSTVDPAMAQSLYDARVSGLLYEAPLAIDYAARPYRLAPGCCELPEVSPDGLVYRLRVRRAGLSAADVVRSLERLRDPEVVSPNGWILREVASLGADGDRVVEVRLKRRQYVFPWFLAMPSAGVRRADGAGTGPFRLASWRKNHEMVFARNPLSDGAPPQGFDTVRYLVVDDASTQWLMFLTGELDILDTVSRDNWDAVVDARGKLRPTLAAQGMSLESCATLDTFYIGFNMKDPVVGPAKKLRQALNAAFDYPTWERFYAGRILPADGPVPPGVAGRLETPFAYRYDLAKARRLMAEAGYPEGRDPKTGRRLVLTMSMGRASQDSREAGELLAAFYERIGVKLELAYFTWDAFLKSVNEGRTQLFRMGWVGDYPDAENFLQLFHSRNASPGPNHTGYANPDYDRAYDAAMAAETAAERNRRWAACQEILREDCPWVYTHFNRANVLVRRRVGGYVPGCFPFGEEARFTAREEAR